MLRLPAIQTADTLYLIKSLTPNVRITQIEVCQSTRK